jgi:hypothetical protein
MIVTTIIVIPFIFIDVEATETDNILDVNNNNRAIQASYDIIMIAGDRVFKVNNIKPSITETFYKRHDRASLKIAEQQKTDRTHFIFDINCCDEFLNSLIEFSE